MSKFINITPFGAYDFLSGNPKMFKDVVMSEAHDSTENISYSTKSIDYIAIVLSGNSVATPTENSVANQGMFNTITKVKFEDEVPRFAAKIRFISNDLFGGHQSLPTDNLPSPFDSGISEAEKQRRITLHPTAYTLFPTFEQNPLFFGTTVSVITKADTFFITRNITSPFLPGGQAGGAGTQVPPGGPHPYKDMMIQGAKFPYDPIKSNLKVKGNVHIRTKLIPAVNRVLASETKGMRLLCIVHAIKEGYKPGSRSYRHNNPGNVGNTDSGKNKGFPTLDDGILHLRNYIRQVAEGKKRAYPLGKQKTIKPYFSQEVADNQKTYKKSPYLPGYTFLYTGQINQYVKIYATGSRAGNSYLSLIISYFKQNGFTLSQESKIQDIIKLN